MDCTAYCIATSYNIKALLDKLRSRFQVSLYRDALHVFVPLGNGVGDVFYFSYGVIVCWNIPKEDTMQILNESRAFATHITDEIEIDEFSFRYGNQAKIEEDEITLPDTENLTKLAISHGLAQSVKLGSFESAIQKSFNETKYIPEDLALQGRIPLSRREIRRKMGELFLKRNYINLHVNVLDVPEFFWEHSELEPMYRMTANYLDLEKRGEVLNQRLGVIHELFEMLGNELNHQHSTRLELTIIWLIIIEVVLSLLRDVFQVF